MIKQITPSILTATEASRIIKTERIQELWSGYGEILRCTLEGGDQDTVVVKHVQLPQAANHPRGWNTDRSHQRKLKSYHVEINWYADLASQCDDNCRVPRVFHCEDRGEEMLMIMEDLDSAGFPIRKSAVNIEEMKACLKWLAYFHAKYMGVMSDQLWEIGTYWHLETRPDELEAMQDLPLKLKAVASKIDDVLNQAKYQTLVHGDAKLANFCFSENGANLTKVAAVDFQYIGHGCGMKDVAYYLSSCLHEDELSNCETALLSFYFKQLELALTQTNQQADFEEIKEEWSRLYAYAWADFYRFLDGWSPGHWKMNEYSKGLTARVLDEINN